MARYYRRRKECRLESEFYYPSLDDAMRAAYDDYTQDSGWVCGSVEDGDDVFFFDDIFDYWIAVEWLKPAPC